MKKTIFLQTEDFGTDPLVRGTDLDPDPSVRGTEPRIRIRIKMSLILNTVCSNVFLSTISSHYLGTPR
jgi:hypothetical protein